MERLFFRNKSMTGVLDFLIEFLVLENVPFSIYDDFLNGDEDYQENLIRELYLKFANRSHYENIPTRGPFMIPDASQDSRYDSPVVKLLVTKLP